MPVRVLAIAFVATLSAGCTAGATGRPQAAPSTTQAAVISALPWPSRLIAREPLMANTLLAGDGRLYGVLDGRLARLDPATGTVLARSASVDALVTPVASDGLIWVIGAHGVVGLDPVSLAPRRSQSVPNPATSNPSLAVDAQRHDVLVGDGRQVIAIHTRTGAVVRRLPIDGVVSGLALRPDSTGLYVATTSGRLEVVDPSTGTVVADPVETDDPLLGLIATGGGLWATAAGGHGAGIVFIPAAALARQRSIGGDSGGGLDVFPTISGGVLWASGHDLTCADPQTGRVRASATIGSSGYVSDLTAVGRTVYGVYTDFGEPSESGLIVVRPPAACGLR